MLAAGHGGPDNFALTKNTSRLIVAAVARMFFARSCDPARMPKMKSYYLLGWIAIATLTAAEVKSDDGSAAYTLVYKFTAGDEFRTRVTQLSTVETKIKGSSQTAKSRSISTKVWKIKSVDEKGNISFVNSVADVEMWQSVTGRPEVSYNSRTDKEPPPDYQQVAKTVGVPLATITIDRAGKILDRRSDLPEINPGIGDLCTPLPSGPAKIGALWSTPDEVKVKTEEGLVKRIEIRHLYKLEKVQTGVATISVESQVLSPVHDPRVQSQIINRLQKGTIRFDIDAGRLLSKQMDLNETVVGFQGAESQLQYLARTTEEPEKTEPAATTAAKPRETK